MRTFSKTFPSPTRATFLAAIPLQNPLVRQSQNKNSLRLTAPLKPNPLRKIFPPKTPPEKSFDLDDLGAWVWTHIDGKTTIEQLIQSFATHHLLNLREAEVSVLAFLKTLTHRNLIALVPAVDKVKG